MQRRYTFPSVGFVVAVIFLAWGTVGAQEPVYAPGGDYIVGPVYGGNCSYACDHGCGCDYGCGCADACCDTGCCGSGCCDAGCCDTCCDCRCQPCCCGWYAGAEVVWAEPRIKDNNAFSATAQNFATDPPVFSTETTAYDYDYEVTPRVFVGYTNCCGFGIRGSWWELDDDADTISFTVPVDPLTRFANGRLFDVSEGETFSASQRLELELAELEFTNDFCLCGARIIVGYGVRYVRYASETREQVVSATDVLDDRGRIFDRFDGVGPTVSIEFIRPLTCHVSVYGNLRGTVAFGERETSSVEENFNSVTGDLIGLTFTSRTADEPQAIGEIQLGVQWSRCCWFVRAGWQAQYWDDATEVESVFNQNFDTGTLGDIGVQGFNITVGYGR